MLDDLEQENEIRILIYELMIVLYRHGFREVNIGAMMHLLGIDRATARDHEDEVVILDDKFAKYVESITETRSSGHTLH